MLLLWSHNEERQLRAIEHAFRDAAQHPALQATAPMHRQGEQVTRDESRCHASFYRSEPFPRYRSFMAGGLVVFLLSGPAAGSVQRGENARLFGRVLPTPLWRRQ